MTDFTTFSGRACPPLLAITLAVAMSVTTALAAEPEKLDDQLLDSLNSELLEGLETLPAEEPEAAAESPEGAPSETAAASEDSFTRIAKQMQEAKRLLAKLESQKKTAGVQKSIITDLDKLIAELEEQCKKSQSSSSSSGKSSDQQTTQRQSPKPSSPSQNAGQQSANKPARDSSDRLGKDEVRKADLEKLKVTMKDLWGQLPERAREQMMQSSPEQFLPKYELMIEEYYKRLAEEQGRE